jgi:hypothetical protein
MKIYTSYFAKSAKLREAGIFPIGIALRPPAYFNGVTLGIVAPKGRMLRNYTTEERYTEQYHNEVLRYVDPQGFLKELERIGRGQDVALCCFEKPGDFCHRHLLAAWLTERTGVEIVEFGVSQTVKSEAPKVEQATLF